MERFLEIKKGLYLVETEIVGKEQKEVPNNHLWVFDRSGSMYSTMRQLIGNMKEKARSLKSGETLSLAWFSGEGQFRYILKGYKISDKEDYKQIDTILDKHTDTVGTTCFSEVLEETDKTIDDLASFGTFSLVVFTDGCPVVSNYNREIEAIFKNVDSLADKLSSAMLVGYGHWYNKSLMQDMAERIGGSLIHASDIDSFGTSLNDYIISSREAGDKVKVDVKHTSPEGVYFSIFGNTVVSYKPKDKKIAYTIGKGAKDYLYILTDKLTGKEEELKVQNGEVVDSKNVPLGERNSFIKGVYGLSSVLSQKMNTLLAVDVLGAIGEKKLIDMLYDSFTNTEYGRAEKEISLAMSAPSKRFQGGKVLGYVKPEDATCLIDVIDVITSDEEAEIFPYHGSGYSRVGRKSVKTTDVEFVPDDTGFKVGNAVWSSSKLNLSLNTTVTGTVELDDEAKKLNLSQEFKCSVYRNFTIVKDGRLNMEKPVMKVSKATFEYLKPLGVVTGEYKAEPTEIDLTAVPVMNRKYANSAKSAKAFCDLAIRESELEGIVKVLKANYKEQKSTVFDPKASYTDAVSEYLSKFHIKNGIFSPPVKLAEATDSYMSKTFEIKIKGLSSLPKIADVEAKLASGKKLTVADTMIEKGLQELKKTKNLEISFKDAQKELRKVRAELLKQKFSIILGKSFFEEFKGERKDSYELDYNGNLFKFEFGETEVKL